VNLKYQKCAWVRVASAGLPELGGDIEYCGNWLGVKISSYLNNNQLLSGCSSEIL